MQLVQDSKEEPVHLIFPIFLSEVAFDLKFKVALVLEYLSLDSNYEVPEGIRIDQLLLRPLMYLNEYCAGLLRRQRGRGSRRILVKRQPENLPPVFFVEVFHYAVDSPFQEWQLPILVFGCFDPLCESFKVCCTCLVLLN